MSGPGTNGAVVNDRRCPEAVFLPSDTPAYESVSEQVMALRRFRVVVEVLGGRRRSWGAHRRSRGVGRGRAAGGGAREGVGLLGGHRR